MENETRTLFRWKQVLVCVVMLACGLLVLLYSVYNEASIAGKFAREIATVLLVGATLSGAYEAMLRHDFMKLVDEQSTKVLSTVDEQSTSLLSLLGIDKEKNVLGLENIHPDSRTFDYSKLILRAERLDVRLNDGRTWFSNNEIALGQRLRDPSKTTRFFITHPHSPMVEVLAKVEDKSINDIKYKIRDTIVMVQRHAKGSPGVKIYGHHLFNAFAAFLSEDEAVVTLYFASRGKKDVPLLRFSASGSASFYSRLVDDFDSLVRDAENLTELNITSEWLRITASGALSAPPPGVGSS